MMTEKEGAMRYFVKFNNYGKAIKLYRFEVQEERILEEIWNDQEKLEDVTEAICEHISSAYQENSPERIYFLMLYNIFKDFLLEINDDVLPNDLTGYKDSVIWNKLFNFQKDAAIGIINKLETYNGCILADSVGLGKTFTALAVIKYYELRNKSVLVLCPKKLAENWLNYNRNLTTNILAKDSLIANGSKCMFGVSEVTFCGFVILNGTVKMEPSKVEAVQSWLEPKTISELRGFLGFINFYRKFLRHIGGMQLF